MKFRTTIVALTLSVFAGGAWPVNAQEVVEGIEWEMRRQLAELGYEYDDPADLVRAVYDPDSTVVAAAMIFLSRQPTVTPQMFAALTSATGFADESLMLGAFMALQKLGDTGWEGAAIARLSTVRSPVVRVMLSEVLAKAGNPEGWQIVRGALAADDTAVGVAIAAAPYFQGLHLVTGEEIDAVAELERLRGQIAPRGQSMRLLSVERSLKQARERQR